MNLNQLIDIILSPCVPLIKEQGYEIFKTKLVSNITSKRLDNIYHIYGNVYENNKVKNYNTHIKINIHTFKVISTNCTCQDFKENCKYKENFICKHIIATTYLFYDLASKKNKKKIDNNKQNLPLLGDLFLNNLNINKTRQILTLDLKISYIPDNKNSYYQVVFKIFNNKYPINSLEDFIYAYINKKNIYFNSDFTYNPKLHDFYPNDKRILRFIEEYIHINKNFSLNSPFYLIKGKYLNLLPKSLKTFLDILKDKKFDFKYEYFDLSISTKHEDLPLSFTIKESDNKLLLTTKTKLPFPLDTQGEVYLYDRNLYIPSNHQNNIYIYLYNSFLNNKQLFFTKNHLNLINLMNLLNSICNDINFDDSTKKLISTLSKCTFYFHKETEIFCEIKINYGNYDIDILNDSRSKDMNIRDFVREEKLLMLMEKFKFIKQNNTLKFIGNDTDLFNLLNKHLSYLRQIGEVILSNKFKEIKLYDSSNIECELTENDNSLELFFKIGNLNEENLSGLFSSFKEKHSFYKTSNNSFIDLENSSTKEFLNLISILNTNSDSIKNTVSFNANKIFYLKNVLTDNKLSLFKGNDLLNRLTNNSLDNINYSIPKDLNATLREYQILGYKWLKFLNYMELGGILADEMGLGKTIQIITFLLSEKNKKSLIITPTSLIYNWYDEFKKFAPSLKVAVIHGNKDERLKILDTQENFDILLTTYGTIKNDFEFYKNHLFDFLIIDEAQNIKNPLAQNAAVIKNINSKIRFALTGTPIENNLLELWSLFDFIIPSYLYTKEKFQSMFINSNENSLTHLKELVHPFILRRIKQDVIKELPDKIEKLFLVEMTPIQRNLYTTYIKDIKQKIKQNKEDRIAIFSYLTQLRQLCLDPSILLDNYKGGSGKLNIAQDLIKTSINQDKKILLFSQFTSVLKNIEKFLIKDKIKYLYLDGSTKPKERINLVNEFNSNENIKIFLISLKAGGTGLNLTSANVVIHFDPWWNPAIESQATDRAHRIGQKNTVEVIKLVSLGTIEEKIITLQQDKKDLINDIMNGELLTSKSINILSKNELLDLFK